MIGAQILDTHTKDPAAVALGRRGGLIGGPARSAKMSPEQRSKIASRASRARWAQYERTVKRPRCKTARCKRLAVSGGFCRPCRAIN